MPIKSFRGKMKDNSATRIRLSTSNGMTGWKVNKFELMGANMNEDVEHVVKVWLLEPAAGDYATEYDFDDARLLAAAFLRNTKAATAGYNDTVIVFDNITFNQDIWISHKDVGGSTEECNYHLELEQVRLYKNSQAVVTLKDIRANIN